MNTRCSFIFTANRCSPIPKLPNAIPLTTHTTEGMIVGYVCNKGCIHNGGTIIDVVCLNGKWNNTDIGCEGNSLHTCMMATVE